MLEVINISQRSNRHTNNVSKEYEEALADLVCIAGLLHGDVPPGIKIGDEELKTNHSIFYQWPPNYPVPQLVYSNEAYTLLLAHRNKHNLDTATKIFLQKYDTSFYIQKAINYAEKISRYDKKRSEFGKRFIQCIQYIIQFALSNVLGVNEPRFEECYLANVGREPQVSSPHEIEELRDTLFRLISLDGISTTGKSLDQIFTDWKKQFISIKGDEVFSYMPQIMGVVSSLIKKYILSQVNLDKYGQRLLKAHGPDTCRLIESDISGGFQLYIGGEDEYYKPILHGEIHIGLRNLGNVYDIDLLRFGLHEGMHFIDAASRDLRIRNHIAPIESGFGIMYSNVVAIAEALAELSPWFIYQNQRKEDSYLRFLKILMLKRDLSMKGIHDASIVEYCYGIRDHRYLSHILTHTYALSNTKSAVYQHYPSMCKKAYLPMYSIAKDIIFSKASDKSIDSSRLLSLFFEGDGLIDLVSVLDQLKN